jgi:hypothetical protein
MQARTSLDEGATRQQPAGHVSQPGAAQDQQGRDRPHERQVGPEDPKLVGQIGHGDSGLRNGVTKTLYASEPGNGALSTASANARGGM